MSWSESRVAGAGRLALLLAAATCVAACGFELQGRQRLPEAMSVVYIATEDTHTEFVRELRRSLDAAGVRVADQRSDAETVVRILRDDSEQRVLSVSARNTPEEYEVFYVVAYAIEMNGHRVLEPQELRLERNYAYDETAVLAKQREEQLLRESMARDLASRVMRRLATL
ncbi:MAG TPA: LPS assembly lipoprotein LptE [Steroidobacteraceae bacterium]|nr:LPS assembly lipoprotein LptE [Steroidobacteraceae bacterium]